MKQTQATKRYNIYFVALLIISVAFLIYLIPFTANAQMDDEKVNSVLVEQRPVEVKSEYKPHVGLLAGLATPEGNYQSSTEYGITLGYQPYIPFGLGLELSSARSDVDGGSDAFDLQRTKLLVQGTYNFGGNMPIINKSYVGVSVGPMIESVADDDNLELGVMPTVGFDYPFALDNGRDISAGLNARYLVSSSGQPNTFSINAMAKYWF